MHSMPRLFSRFSRLSMSDRAFARVEAIDQQQQLSNHCAVL
jgi:hypothetical protein